MAISIITVPVPLSGDGPSADISTLVGEKTVELSGFFTGNYVLLASHDNSLFVPVLNFNSDGPESIKQTLSDSYRSVKVRSVAIPSSPIQVNISGITSQPGANKFAVVASSPAGTSGPQAPLDLFGLFPPTGLEANSNLICAGLLRGSVVVEGSLNGQTFNPMGAFTASPQGRSLLGSPQPLEFSPLSIPEKIRYLRFNIQGQIVSSLTITIGGSTSSSGGALGTTDHQKLINRGYPPDVTTDCHPASAITTYPAEFQPLPLGALVSQTSLDACLYGLDANMPASYDITKVAYGMLDYVGGSDSNPGFIVAPAGTVFNSTQTAATACKTLTGLKARLPKVGAGRKMVILVKNGNTGGTTYYKQDGVTVDDLDFSDISGYSFWLVRGSTDLTNSVADKTLLGFQTAITGPNSDGSWTCAAGSTAQTYNVAAGTIPAEPVALGFRVRFTGNVTPSLANYTQMVYATTANTITQPYIYASGTPAAGDTFFIERSGAIFNGFKDSNCGSSVADVYISSSHQTVGFAFTASVTNGVLLGAISSAMYSGIDQRSTASFPTSVLGFLHDIENEIWCLPAYLDETGTVVQVDCASIRSEDWIYAKTKATLKLYRPVMLYTDSTHGSHGSSIIACRFDKMAPVDGGFPPVYYRYSDWQGGVFWGGLTIQPVGASGGKRVSIGYGTINLDIATRFVNEPLEIVGSNLYFDLNGIEFEQYSYLKFGDSGNQNYNNNYRLHNLTGTVVTGPYNTGYGVFLRYEKNSYMEFFGCTLTGPSGDICVNYNSPLAGIKYADLALTNIVTPDGVELTASPYFSALKQKALLILNESGTSLAVGQVVRSNGTDTQVTLAKADSQANVTGIVGVMVTSPANGAYGYMTTENQRLCKVSGTPAIGVKALLDATVAGSISTPTSPPPVIVACGVVLSSPTGGYAVTTGPLAP